MDQKAASREAHKVEAEGVRSRKEGLEETGRALKAFAAEGAKRSKKCLDCNKRYRLERQ